MKADVAAHPANGNLFALNQYQVKGALPGAYVVSAGDAVVPASISVNEDYLGSIQVALTGANVTAKQVRDAFGIAEGDFLTSVVIKADSGVHFFRVQLNFSLADDTVITADNIAQLFIIDNPLGEPLQYFSGDGFFGVALKEITGECWGIIYSKKVDAGFKHSNTTLNSTAVAGTASDVVLPTYPEGSQRFLNGGEL